MNIMENEEERNDIDKYRKMLDELEEKSIKFDEAIFVKIDAKTSKKELSGEILTKFFITKDLKKLD